MWSLRRRSQRRIWLVLMCVWLAAYTAPRTGASTAPLVSAAGGSLYASGLAAPLPVQVAGVQKLGAATVLVTYDPALIKPVGCARSLAFDVGLCNTSVDQDGDGVNDAVRFNAISLTGVTAADTPVMLANISWQAVADVTTETLTTVGLEVETFADVDGKPLAHTALSGEVMVLPPLPRQKTFLPFLSR